MSDKKRILCFGDSNTFGYDAVNGGRYDDAHRWVSVMQKILGDEYDVVSEGLNGRTTVLYDDEPQICSGIDYFTPCLLSHYPLDSLIIMLGTNDACYMRTAKEVTDGVEKLVRIALENPIWKDKKRIIIVVPTVIGAGQGKTEEYYFTNMIQISREIVSLYKKLSKKYGIEVADANVADCKVEADLFHLTPQSHINLGKFMAQQVLKGIKSNSESYN